jgi:hypothetical protein
MTGNKVSEIAISIMTKFFNKLLDENSKRKDKRDIFLKKYAEV